MAVEEFQRRQMETVELVNPLRRWYETAFQTSLIHRDSDLAAINPIRSEIQEGCEKGSAL